MSAQLGLRPLEIPAIADEATRLVRRRLWLYYSLSLPVMVPLLIVTVCYFQHIYWYSGAYEGYQPILVKWTALLGLLLMARFVSHGAITHAAALDIDGAEPSFWGSWKVALKRSGALIFGGLLLWGAAVVGGMLFVIPGFFAIGLLGGFAYMVIEEGRSYFGMLRHSLSSTQGLLSRILLLQGVLLFGAVIFGVGLGLTIPALLWLWGSFLGGLLGIDVSVIERLISTENPVTVWGLVAFVVLVFEPVRVVAQVRMMIDGKIRREGFDLLDRVSRLTGAKLKASAAAALLLTLALPAAAQEVISPGGLKGRVQRALAVVEAQLDEIERGNDVKERELRWALGELDGAAVTGPGGEVYEHEGQGLEARAEGLEEALPEEAEVVLEELRLRLRLLDDGLEGVEAEAAPEAAREAAQAILEQQRFQRRKRHEHNEDLGLSGVDSAIQKFVNWLSRFKFPEIPFWERFKAWLKGLFNWNMPSMPGGVGNWSMSWGDSGLAILAVLVVLAIAFGAWMFFRSRVSAGGEEGVTELTLSPGARRQEPIVAYETTEETWRTDARRFASNGQFDYAVRSSYAGLLLTLNSKGWIEYDKTRTNWEYLRDVRRRSKGLAKEMDPLTRQFDDKWYGKKDCSEDEYQRFREDLDKVVGDLDGEG